MKFPPLVGLTLTKKKETAHTKSDATYILFLFFCVLWQMKLRGFFSREMTFTLEGISSFIALLYHGLHITSLELCPLQLTYIFDNRKYFDRLVTVVLYFYFLHYHN